MDQSLSGGSGSPLRMTLTVICGRESSDMRRNYSMRRFLTLLTPKNFLPHQTCEWYVRSGIEHIYLFVPQRRRRIQARGAEGWQPRGQEGDDQE